MPPASKKPIALNFTDCSGGINSIEHPIRISPNQVQPQTVGFILKKSGVEKCPGVLGLTASTTFTTYLKMVSAYRDLTGTERLLALSNGVLSSVATAGGSKGALTSLYTLGGTGEGWSCDAFGKHWICNGTDVVKAEGATVYQVGIDAPTGVTAAATAGAGLDDGQYSIYASYGRRVSGVDKLYSDGQYVDTVTLGSGNNQITISNFANSSDPQVGQKVIWIKNVTNNEVIHYFFYGTNDNTTTSFIITSDSAKDTGNIFEYESLGNIVPPAGEFIYYFANRVWVLYNNILYYSEKSFGNAYNLEKFRSEFTVAMPHRCTGIFSVGYNLYVNTESGIIVLGNADPTSEAYLIEPRWHFAYMRTVARWNNGVIGVTNDGVRIFDGMRFTDFDIGMHVKSIIDTLYNSSTNFQPCGYVYKRKIRNEYHLMWRDSNIGTAVNNRHIVLNLDTLYYNGPIDNIMAWEFHPYSGNYAAVLYDDNKLYVGQSHASASKIYEELKDKDTSRDCYTRNGVLLTEYKAHTAQMRSKVVIPNVFGVMWLNNVYFLLQNTAKCQFRVVIADKFGTDSGTIEVTESLGAGGDTMYWDNSNWDESFWVVENAQVFKKKIKELKGRSCYIEIIQTANDPDFRAMELNITGYQETGNTL